MLKLREIRVKKGVHQKEIAKILNISQQAVSDIENGKRKINSDEIVKLSLFFDVDPNELLNFEEAYKKYTDYLISLKEDEDIEQ